MTLEQFKESILAMGYKEYKDDGMHNRFKKRNREICIQDIGGINIYLDIERKTYSMELRQFNVTDFAKALKNIEKFERKIGR